MLQPFKLKFPEQLSNNFAVGSEALPVFVQHIEYASPLYTVTDAGEFVSQTVSGDGYWIEWWSFLVKENCQINLEIVQPFIGIAVFIEGDLNMPLIGNGEINIAPKSYHVFYSPPGLQKINLFKGIQRIVIFTPPEYYFGQLMSEYPRMSEISKHFNRVKQNGIKLETLPLPQRVLGIITKLQHSKRRGVALDIELRTHTFQILLLYNQQLHGVGTNMHYPTALEKAVLARNYIIANLGDPNLGGLNEMALRFHLTSKPLTREFRKLTGKTIPQYISDRRLQWAKQLLSDPAMSVFEIAFIVGFTDTANFIKSFKRKFGHTPGQGRKI